MSDPSRSIIGVAGPITTEAFREHLHDPCADIPNGLGGVPVTDLVRELLSRGYSVVVATLSPDVAENQVFRGPRLQMHIGPYRPTGRARDAFRVERRSIQRALSLERPDIAHAHWTYEFALGALASRVPTLVTVHDWAPAILRFHRDSYRIVRLLMQAATVVRGQHFSTVSPYIVRALRRWRRPAHLVPNGFADHWFDSRPRQLRTTSPRLISVNSGFGERKNSTTLLRSFQILQGSHPSAILTLVGAGYQVDGPAHEWARTEGLTAGVIFRGPLSHADSMAAMADADLLVHPSLEESFGMTLVEAMAQGTPVVGGARSGAVPWVLAEGRAGLLADISDPDQLASAMSQMLSDETRWSHFSRAGYEHASATFRLSQVVDRYLELYDTISADFRP